MTFNFSKFSKYIFLDIDGVLATDTTYKEWWAAGSPDTLEWKVKLLDKNCIELLNFLIEEVNPGLIISSNWKRLEINEYSLSEIFKRAKISAYPITLSRRIIGTTPDVFSRHHGIEIDKYVKVSKIKPESFIILDDMEEAGLFYPDRLILTSESIGLTSLDIE